MPNGLLYVGLNIEMLVFQPSAAVMWLAHTSVPAAAEPASKTSRTASPASRAPSGQIRQRRMKRRFDIRHLLQDDDALDQRKRSALRGATRLGTFGRDRAQRVCAGGSGHVPWRSSGSPRAPSSIPS